ncbi:hypothetical protein NUU98_21020 [Cronobacter sakazakii]|uniref:hypothetical protein n=1 Tax=Cronobacter sakazakii TaxID=28141 RepID=UPI0009B1E7AE|nr:hypothetical protein [Cronobacter sakazakii]MDQ1934155.1 hypothetical protein [Cronobacter sakazakii]MDQ1936601.1 hypothetical protein [Cronobacter sakazakii]MDQ1942497.1 hypothetical protein [Cronobacter sakazakii]MDQ1946773.1 hypothetical protein [Cronobacter sakazakii]MDQ1949286.1 hypothetical protein [Cronobacter sakazakii]
MAFPSPAADYAERTLTVDTLCKMDANCRIIETDTGYAVIDLSARPEEGETVLATFDGRAQFAKWMRGVLITEDGEAIEGEALDGVIVHGLLTYTINRFHDDDSVV